MFDFTDHFRVAILIHLIPLFSDQHESENSHKLQILWRPLNYRRALIFLFKMLYVGCTKYFQNRLFIVKLETEVEFKGWSLEQYLFDGN